MTKIGAKVSRKGDVTTAPDANLVFSTDLLTLPIFLEGLNDVAVPAFGNATLTVNHALGFVPFVLAWFLDPNVAGEWQWIPTTGANSLGGFINIQDIRIDTQNVVFPIVNGTSAGTITIHYIVFNFPIALSI